MDPRTDGELARRVLGRRHGEAAAEEAELCRRLAPRVRLYGLRHLRDEDAAADLVQVVLLRTIEKLREGGVREPERVASFVLGVARMACHEARRTGRREIALTADVALPAAASPPEPLGRDHLARCLDALRERERTVLVLSYYQDESATAIGSALGLSDGNVRVIRCRALEKLRGCMGGKREATA
jgi:RNA polymerase sigma-70 factor (ECF subfamily)